MWDIKSFKVYQNILKSAEIFWDIFIVNFQEYAGKFQKGATAQSREEAIGNNQEGIGKRQ